MPTATQRVRSRSGNSGPEDSHSGLSSHDSSGASGSLYAGGTVRSQHRRDPPQSGHGPVHGLPYFSSRWVSPLSPQSPAGCPKFLPGCCRAPACSPLALIFRHRRRLCLLDLSLSFFEARSPGAPAGPSFPADSINSPQVPTGTNSKPHAPPRVPILFTQHRRAPIPPNPGLAPLGVPPPGLSGPHPTAGPRPQLPGPKDWPRPLIASRTRDRQKMQPWWRCRASFFSRD